MLRLRLRGIKGNDLQIPPVAEREKSILCACTGMDAAESGMRTGALFDELDATAEVAAAEQDVVKQ